MKTAEQRAAEVLEVLGVPMHQNRVRSVVSVLKQYARDQRHLCTESIPFLGERSMIPDDPGEARAQALASAQTSVFNTPFPGE